jgi:CHAT domain-containing protein/antitoxin component YwqK of YwqJK toxin-antitoxin module/Flp pilus assembly protein TadD
MKRYLLSLFFIYLASLVVAQTFPKNANKTDKKGRRQGTWTILYDKDWKPTTDQTQVAFYRLLAYKDDKPVGKVRDYFRSGKLQMEGEMRADRPEELLVGKVTFFRENGTVESEKEYDTQGKFMGVAKEYFADGKLASQIAYQSGKKQGKSTVYYENGNLKTEENYDEDILIGEVKKYYMHGKLQYAVPIQNGLWNGKGMLYDSLKGFVRKEFTVINEVIEGKETFFYENGAVDEYNFWENGLKKGESKGFYLDGTVRYTGTYLRDHREGQWTWYYPNGNKEEQIFYKNGQLEGVYEYFNPRGQVVQRRVYDTGKEILPAWKVTYLQGDAFWEANDYQNALQTYQKALPAIEKEVGKEGVDYVNTLNDIGLCYQKLKQYEKSLAPLEESKNLREKIFGKEHQKYLVAVENLSVTYKNLSQLDKELELLLENYAFLQKKNNTKSLAYAGILKKIGKAYIDKEMFKKAEPFYVEENALLKALVGENHRDYLVSLNNLGSLYSNLSQYEKSIDCLQKCLKGYEETIGKETENYAITLYNLADVYVTAGKLEEGEKLGLESLALREKVMGKAHEDYASSLTLLGNIYAQQNLYEKSEQYFEQAKDIKKKIFGAESTEYARAMNNLAVAYHNAGRYENAEKIFLQSLPIIEKKLGKSHPTYANTLTNLAGTFTERGIFEQAEALLVESLQIRENATGKESYVYTQVAFDLAGLYNRLGNYTKATKIAEEVCAIRLKILGKTHTEYGNAVNLLGLIYDNQGKSKEALKCYETALSIEEKTTKSIRYSSILNNISIVYQNFKEYEKAEPIALKSLAIEKEILGNKHPRISLALNNIASLYMDMHEYEKAEKMYIESLEIISNSKGTASDSYALTCGNIALLSAYMKKYEQAGAYYQKSLRVKETQIKKVFPTLSEKEKEFFYYTMRYRYDDFNTYAMAYGAEKPAVMAHVFDNQIFSKALLFNETNKVRQTIMNSKNMGLVKEYQTWQEKKNYLAKVYQMSIQDKQKNGINQEKLEEEANELEKQLAYQADKLNISITTKNYTWQDVQKTLQPQEAVVEIIRTKQLKETQKFQFFGKGIRFQGDSADYALITEMVSDKAPAYLAGMRRGDKIISVNNASTKGKNTNQVNELLKCASCEIIFFSQTQNKEIIKTVKADSVFKTTRDYTPVYLVLVLTSNGLPMWTVLENGEQLEGKYLKNYRNNIKFKTQDKYSYTQFWKPIVPYLQGITKIYASLDGVYNSLSLATLYNTETQKYLSDELQIQLISNSTNLITYQKDSQKLNKNVQDYQVHLFGAPEYAKNKITIPTETEKGKITLDSTQRFLSSDGKIAELIGTKIEVEAITKHCQSQNLPTKTYLHEEATEDALKKLKSPYILHIATHGYFLNDITHEKMIDSPLLRCGLLLADAENGLKTGETVGKENGVLTAQEALNLNLDGTDLVVLSACETGLGEIRNGEGVFGLQRAFQQAGAKTVLMSLWTVSDNATQELMTLFYENLITKKQPKRLAFQNAQNDLKKKFPEPYFWGAFVMVGE